MPVAGEIVRLHFTLLQEDGVTPLSGKVDGDFTKQLIRDAVLDPVTGSIVEIGTTGVYAFSFTPDKSGFWYAEVFEPETECLFHDHVDVGSVGETQMNVAYDESITTLFMEVWLDRDEQSIPAAELVSCAVEVFDDGGVSLFTVASVTPDANGRFSLIKSPITLSPDRPFNATVTVVDSRGSVTTFQAFSTVG